MQLSLQEIRAEILSKLKSYGIHWDANLNELSVDNFKDVQRKLAEHSNVPRDRYRDKVRKFLARPEDINIHKIDPYLVMVEQRAEHNRLWAHATSFWSVPVTSGYGRRMRYFVFDRFNDKLIGIIGLCDPIIGLETRDVRSIGWTKGQKEQRLYNCLTAYILGAIPPYNEILGGKLVALSVLFPEVRQDFHNKYRDSISIISQTNKAAHLVYVDTLGAFGKSAIYTRLLNWEFGGYTKGQSHLHITANGSWELIKQVVPKEEFDTYRYGKGPNWKMRVLRRGLQKLNLSEEIMSIGWQRGYYRCPLAHNWREYLLGKTDDIQWKQFSKNDVVSYWRKQWVYPRLERLEEKLYGSK
jgi:hypothetical protein